MSCALRALFEKLIASGSAILRSPLPLRERVRVRGNIICRAGFARVFTCGSPHRGRVSCARAFPGPRPSGSLVAAQIRSRRICLMSGQKTILPGAKLDALQRARQGPRQGWRGSKKPKRRPPGWRDISLRFSPESALASTRRAQTTRLGLKHESRFSRFRLRCSGAPYGEWKNHSAEYASLFRPCELI